MQKSYKIFAFFYLILISFSLLLPVFAGASSSSNPGGSTVISQPSQFNDPDRAIGSGFVYNPGSVTYSSHTFYYDYVITFSSISFPLNVSSCPSSFLIQPYNSGSRSVLYNDTDIIITVTLQNSVSIGNMSVSGNVIKTSSSTIPYVVYLYPSQSITFSNSASSNTWCYFSLSPNPQDWTPPEPPPPVVEVTSDALSPFYDMLSNSGVNEEWSSIGVVVLASVLCLSLVIFIFKICFGKR